MKNQFNKNVFRIIFGNGIGSVITFFSLPILTYIYDQTTLGTLQLIISAISIFIALATLKYDMAILMPKSKLHSDSLVFLSVIVLTFISFILVPIILLPDLMIANFLGVTDIENYIVYITLGVFIGGFYNISTNVLIREKNFKLYSFNNIERPIINNGLGILLGFASPDFIYLYLSHIISQFYIGIKNLMKSSVKKIYSFQRAIYNLKKYKKFALYNTPLEFINTFSVQLPVFFIGYHFGAGAVGIYMVADRLLNSPLRIIGQSFQKVFYKEAIDRYNNKGKYELTKLYLSTVKKLAIIGLMPLLVVLFLAPLGTAFFLGESWSEAGTYMQILIIGFYFRFINSPVSNTLAIVDRQEVGLIIVIIFTIIKAVAMVIWNKSIFSMLLAFTIVNAVFYFIYLLVIYLVINKKNQGGKYDT